MRDPSFGFNIFLSIFFPKNPAFTPKDNQAQVRSFHSLGLRDDILQGLYGLSITKPTVTQVKSISFYEEL